MRWPDIEKISRWLLFSGKRHCVVIGREGEREKPTAFIKEIGERL